MPQVNEFSWSLMILMLNLIFFSVIIFMELFLPSLSKNLNKTKSFKFMNFFN